MEEFREVRLVPFHVAHVYKRDALAEMPGNVFESFNLCRKGRRGRKVFVLFAFFVAKTVPRSLFPVPQHQLEVRLAEGDGVRRRGIDRVCAVVGLDAAEDSRIASE